jgi:hypothetical protein
MKWKNLNLIQRNWNLHLKPMRRSMLIQLHQRLHLRRRPQQR